MADSSPIDIVPRWKERRYYSECMQNLHKSYSLAVENTSSKDVPVSSTPQCGISAQYTLPSRNPIKAIQILNPRSPTLKSQKLPTKLGKYHPSRYEPIPDITFPPNKQPSPIRKIIETSGANGTPLLEGQTRDVEDVWWAEKQGIAKTPKQSDKIYDAGPTVIKQSSPRLTPQDSPGWITPFRMEEVGNDGEEHHSSYVGVDTDITSRLQGALSVFI